MNPKIRRDPYLRPVCERWGEQAATDAGWFDDDDRGPAPLDDVEWLCTPTAHLRRRAATALDADGDPAGRPVVLLSTGGFFPVHGGHLAMMTTARRCIEAAGRTVLGGYLSPAHDGYIAVKCGSVPVGVSTRLGDAAAAVQASGWLAIDPWEALARRVAVNYTDVTARLENYLRAHVDPAVDVVYVCGGDNARFALAFTERGGCVVVGRPGADETVARWRRDGRVAGSTRIHWADGADAASSSAVRATAPSGAPTGSGTKRTLRLRLEDERAVATLALPPAAWRRFQDGLQAELATRVALQPITLEAQDVAVATRGTISLDPLLPADVDLGISRLFDLGGYQALGHVARPGSPPLDVQFDAVPAGSWSLRDDDRATGSTVAFLREHLPPAVVLTDTTFALPPASAGDGDLVAGREPEDEAEIADSRDFLLGTDHGGLVITLPDGTIGRAPYLLPYVDPAVRSGLPGGEAVRFSAAIWELNASVFAATDLTVGDLPPPAARTLTGAGESSSTTLADVCTRHAAMLRDLLPR